MAVSVILVLHNNSLFLKFNQPNYDIQKHFKQVFKTIYFCLLYKSYFFFKLLTVNQTAILFCIFIFQLLTNAFS